ncbi:Hsp20/alpha crystallin family protein [Pleomorphovibrio marinus]|uniref:Hsp20/alpha crystallin family protein n=1 Tax=Pleomorphovibrio marinus TaxID=2164132 RepID=UPI0018E54430|nr:Hsp20/alpha crystallin family protein [Pleomorphovibrio marinus]
MASFMDPIWELDNWTKQGDHFVEENEGWQISISLPGMDKRDIRLKVEDRQLVVEGEISRKSKHSVSRQAVRRSYYLPERLDLNKIKAEMKNGLLEVTIPYAIGTHQARLINVEIAGHTPYVEVESSNSVKNVFSRIASKIKSWLS